MRRRRNGARGWTIPAPRPQGLIPGPRSPARGTTGVSRANPLSLPLRSCSPALALPRPPRRGRLTLAAAHTVPVPVPVPGARGRRAESDAPVPAHLPLRSRRSPRATAKITRQRPSASRAALAEGNKLNPREQRWSLRGGSSSGGRAAPARWSRGASGGSTLRRGTARAGARRPRETKARC